MKKQSSLWLFSNCMRYTKGPLLVLILVTLIRSAVLFLTSVLYGGMVGELSAMVTESRMSALFIVLASVYVFTLLFGGVSENGLGCLYSYAYGKIDGTLSKLIFQKVYDKEHKELYQKDFLDLGKFIYDHYNEIIASMETVIRVVFGSLSVVLASLAVFIFTEPLMMVYLLFVVVIRGGTSFYFSRKYYDLMKNNLEGHIRRESYYRELMSNRKYGKEIRVYNLLAFLQKKWMQYYDIIWGLRKKRNLQERKYQSLGSILITVMDYSVVLLLVYSAYLGNIDLAAFTMLYSLSRTCSAQVGNVAESLTRSAYQSTTYMGELRDFLHPVTRHSIERIAAQPACGGGLCYGEFQELRAENISFAYPGSNKMAVDGASLTLKKGEIISVLGYNGSGKTTLSKLLLGLFMPDEGSVYINGHKFTREKRDEIYQYFGVAFQDYMPYLLTLKQNVGIGCVERIDDRELLNNAYEKANLERILKNLDRGEDTPIGKAFWTDNADLSGGEWQRVILARAHMGEPEILVLDEPTASIDPIEELRMLENLRRYVKGRTAVLISHRIGFARLADRIVMMAEGRVTETGTHEELLAAKGYYASLFKSQRELYAEKEVLLHE